MLRSRAVLLAALLTAASPAGAQQASPIPLDDPMDFVLLSGHGPLGEQRWAQGAGLITPETPARLEAFLREHGRPGLVIALSSQGGDVGAALAMGRAIRAARAVAVVGFHAFPAAGGDTARFHAGRSLCHGACALAFLGGARRALDPRAQLGFHYRGLAFPDGGPRADPAQRRSADEAVGPYVAEMGIDERLMRRIAGTEPNGEAVLLPIEELRVLRVAEALALAEDGVPGWFISRRPDTPLLRRTALLVPRPHRPITVELTMGCYDRSAFRWVLDVLLADAIDHDDARLRSLTIRLGRERIERPEGESEAWLSLGGPGFAWFHETPRTSFAAAATSGFSVELAGEDGWAGRVELSDGLAPAITQLGRDCDAYLARPPAPGR